MLSTAKALRVALLGLLAVLSPARAQDACPQVDSTTYLTSTLYETRTLAFAAKTSTGVYPSAIGPFWYFLENGTSYWLDGAKATATPITVMVSDAPLNTTSDSTVYVTKTSFRTTYITVPAPSATRVASAYHSSSAGPSSVQSSVDPNTVVYVTETQYFTVTASAQYITVTETASEAPQSSPSQVGDPTNTIYDSTTFSTVYNTITSYQTVPSLPASTVARSGSISYNGWNSSTVAANRTSAPSISSTMSSNVTAGPVSGSAASTSGLLVTVIPSSSLVPSVTLSTSRNSSSSTLANSTSATPSSTTVLIPTRTATTIPSTSTSNATSPLSSISAAITSMASISTSITSTSSSLVNINSTTTFSTTSVASATPTFCGQSGNFTLNWDDEPNFTPSNGTDVPFPPIFNPYHHFYFADGYDYAPPPNEPFPPTSGTRLALFMPNASTETNGSPGAGLERPGEIGTGPRAASTAFWFNAYSAYLGCDNSGPTNCDMEMTGYVYDAATKAETVAAQQTVSVPPCPGFVGCSLTLVDFTNEFVGLSGIQFRAIVNATERVFFLDDLNMGWYDNSCTAGLLRQQSV